MASLRDHVLRQGTIKSSITGPGIPYDFFMIWLWMGVAIATAFFLGRLCARILGPRRLYVDDIFILITWVLVVTTGALWQWEAANMYYILDVQAGLAVPGPDLWDRMHHWLVVLSVTQLFYYTALITFKLSMLFFFRRLGNSFDWFRCVWWLILVFCLGTYFVAVGTQEYRCGLGDRQTVLHTCDSDEQRTREITVLDSNCALDVVSDFLIMTIAVILLWNVKVHNRGKKLAIMALFSLSLFTIALSIVRAVQARASSTTRSGLIDPSHLTFWNACHSFLCVVVACSSAFPQLFMASKRGSKKKPAWSPTQSFHDRMLSSFRLRRKKQDMSLLDMTATTQTGERFESVGLQSRTAHFSTPLESETTIGSGDGERMESMRGLSGPTPMAACYICPCSAPVHPWQVSRVPNYHASQLSA